MKLDRHIVRLLARLPLPQGRIQVARMWIAEWLDQHTVLYRARTMGTEWRPSVEARLSQARCLHLPALRMCL